MPEKDIDEYKLFTIKPCNAGKVIDQFLYYKYDYHSFRVLG